MRMTKAISRLNEYNIMARKASNARGINRIVFQAQKFDMFDGLTKQEQLDLQSRTV